MKHHPLRNAHLLVIGGAGFMGSNFIHAIYKEESSIRITVLDLLTYAGTKKNLSGIPPKQMRFVKGDLCDTPLLTRLMKQATHVINFAAETHVDRSIHTSSEPFIRTNIQGVHSLLTAARALTPCPRIIHISTDEVWGDLPLTSSKKFDEQSPFLPNSPYAASKACGDMLIRSYVRTYGLPIIVTHSTNNFGPRQYPEKMIPFFITRALAGLPLPLYGNGKQRRDWLYVDDHSAAIALLLTKGVPGEVYAISHEGRERANHEVARELLKRLQKSPKNMVFVADRPAHDLRYAVRSRKLRQLGWRPKTSFADGLTKTIAWYTSSKKMRRAVLNPHIAV